MRSIVRLTAAALPMLLTACGTTPHLDRGFGNSVRLLQAQQTIYPDAGRQRRPAANGMDGPAATAAYDAYQRSFTTKEESNNDSLSIGLGNKR
ncbi:pilus assembly protein [Duganella callida]|uniref:Pilus assembly protein n=1 Tax=Duganella callida TaxID=2561932 RepID=A0A4Y9SM26_9BURK|nr:pilus assembly protein [Duganella callida]TFW27710.1 pilus assembly protein [Duganella callida]